MPKRSYKPFFGQSKRHKNRIIASNLTYNQISAAPHEFLLNSRSSDEALSVNSNVLLPVGNCFDENHVFEMDCNNLSASSSDDSEPELNCSFVELDRPTHTNDTYSCFYEKFSCWANEEKIPNLALNKLLKILKGHNCFKDLPNDYWTLLHTFRQYEIVPISNGTYHHFGIANGISSILNKCPAEMIPDDLTLHGNIDGLHLTKSSGSQFWPILGALKNIKSNKPFLIGCYHGYNKPESANLFLEEFVNDINKYLSDGINFAGRKLNAILEVFTCDAPARAFVKNIKGHNGYYGCDRCELKGRYVDNRVTFPEKDAKLNF